MQDWSDNNPATLALHREEIIQVCTVQESWGFGWPLKAPERTGWFPLCYGESVASSVSYLGSEKENKLCMHARDCLIDLISSVPEPAAMQNLFWEGELPAAVADSEASWLATWRERFQNEDAMQQARDEPALPAAENDPRNATFLTPEEPHEDNCPLFVCTMTFRPPPGGADKSVNGLLQMQVGDLVRVASLRMPQQYWYSGFLADKPDVKGWFPRRSVTPLEKDAPLAEQTQQPSSRQRPPPPQVPEFLKAR
ncbi:unnamed protein product [Polarella glacialis]|uniref:SH3 domain-containing protein n=1 Tax=Polarella glacialis TaxID=89957 RepID=A0A813E374_POLGL|nr:unnamed protein product [Polarella glacialis]